MGILTFAKIFYENKIYNQKGRAVLGPAYIE
jgi:hypothetical protein